MGRVNYGTVYTKVHAVSQLLEPEAMEYFTKDDGILVCLEAFWDNGADKYFQGVAQLVLLFAQCTQNKPTLTQTLISMAEKLWKISFLLAKHDAPRSAYGVAVEFMSEVQKHWGHMIPAAQVSTYIDFLDVAAQ